MIFFGGIILVIVGFIAKDAKWISRISIGLGVLAVVFGIVQIVWVEKKLLSRKKPCGCQEESEVEEPTDEE